MKIFKDKSIVLKEVYNYEEDNAFCTIININDISIMLDCGIPKTHNYDKYLNNIDLISKVDILLISSISLEHCGAFNFIYNILKNKIVITSLPNKYFIELFLYNIICLYNNNIDMIENNSHNCEQIIPIKYKENKKFELKGLNIKIKIFELGYNIGSSYFKIKIDNFNIGYFNNGIIKKQFHLKPLNIKYIENINHDLLIYGFEKSINKHNCYKNIENIIKHNIYNAIKDNKSLCIITNNFDNIYIIIIYLINIIRNNNQVLDAFVIAIPIIFKSLITIIKSLTEYMSPSINQDFYEENNFIIDNIIYYQEYNTINTTKKKIYINLLHNFIYGKDKQILSNNNINKIYIGEEADIITFKIEEINDNFFSIKAFLNYNHNNNRSINDTNNEENTKLEIISTNDSDINSICKEVLHKEKSENKYINNFIIKNNFYKFKENKIKKVNTKYGIVI